MSKRLTVLEECCQRIGCPYTWREPMASHTTFKIGGAADLFVQPTSEFQIMLLLGAAAKERTPVTVVGRGSNLLVADEGIRGMVLCLGEGFGKIRLEDGGRLVCQAGASLASVCKAAMENSLTGLEFAWGIPGTIGGAVVMNAGAYGGEMKDILSSVTVLKENGEEEVILADQLQMGYRTSVIKEKGYVVLEAVLHLEKGDAGQIAGRMEELKRKRVEKQPLEFPSAGSTFKRPEGYFAGKLIMDAGLRGYRVGGASISEKHCGFVVNDQEATARDIRTLMEDVQRIVRERFQVELEPEVKFLGEF